MSTDVIVLIIVIIGFLLVLRRVNRPSEVSHRHHRSPSIKSSKNKNEGVSPAVANHQVMQANNAEYEKPTNTYDENANHFTDLAKSSADSSDFTD